MDPLEPDGSDATEITRLLLAYGEGDRGALDRLMPVLYERLRLLAHARLRNERVGHTLGTTALVHEAYLRLVDVRQVRWQSRAHFLSMAARAMRRVLIDHAERRSAQKRGGGDRAVTLDEAHLIADDDIDRLLDLNRLLRRLEDEHPRAGEVLSQHVFGGLSQEETAESLGVSVSTVERELRFARAWLARAWTAEGTA